MKILILDGSREVRFKDLAESDLVLSEVRIFDNTNNRLKRVNAYYVYKNRHGNSDCIIKGQDIGNIIYNKEAINLV